MYKILKDINEQMNFTSVLMNEVNESDRSFIFSFPERFADNEIVKKVGILEPVIFYREAENFIIVDGIKRYNAAKESGMEFISGMFLIKGWWKKSDIFLYNVLKNTLSRNLNIVEKAEIVNKIFFEKIFGEFKGKDDILKLINIEKNDKILNMYKDICSLIDSLKSFIVQKSLPVSTSHILTRFPTEEQEIISKIFIDYSISVNKAKKFLDLFYDLKNKSGLNLNELLEQVHSEEILSDKKMTNEQKIEKFEVALTEERYPKWAESRKNLDKNINDLTKKSNIHISYDPYLESGKVKIDFDAKNLKELKNKSEQLNNLTENPAFSKIFEII